MTRLPDFVVLGQGKAGTSLIYQVLQQNPLIGLSQPKELHYFSANFDKGHDWYAPHFAHIPDQAESVGEVSPSYLTPQCVQRVADTLGTDTKVAFVLRRPIERAYSRYLQDICASETGRPFFRMVRGLPRHMEMLHEAIRLCYRLFGPKNVLPLFYEIDVAGNDPRFEARILEFLGLPPADHARAFLETKPVNPGVMPHYIYSGPEGLTLRARGKRYVIPPEHLIFCGQKRNSKIYENPSPEQLVRALTQQSQWTRLVSTREYKAMMRQIVRPAAKALEDEFGFDMQHWRGGVRSIAYEPAPPPKIFEKGK